MVSSVEIVEESLMIFVKERITGLHDIVSRFTAKIELLTAEEHDSTKFL